MEIKVTEKIDAKLKQYYCKCEVYDECTEILPLNKSFLARIIQKAKRMSGKQEYVLVVGTGFLKMYVRTTGESFQKSATLDIVYLSAITEITKLFRTFNDNCVFIIPKKEINNLEKIWR